MGKIISYITIKFTRITKKIMNFNQRLKSNRSDVIFSLKYLYIIEINKLNNAENIKTTLLNQKRSINLKEISLEEVQKKCEFTLHVALTSGFNIFLCVECKVLHLSVIKLEKKGFRLARCTKPIWRIRTYVTQASLEFQISTTFPNLSSFKNAAKLQP